MTTAVKIQSHNFPVRVRVLDVDPAGEPDTLKVTEERVLTPEDGEVTFYCTTTRKIEAVDIDYPAAEAGDE